MCLDAICWVAVDSKTTFVPSLSPCCYFFLMCTLIIALCVYYWLQNKYVFIHSLLYKLRHHASLTVLRSAYYAFVYQHLQYG